MAGFVFIHGAWLGGCCFAPVAHLLEAAGHRVDAPDLPGMGANRSHERATLAQWADFAVERCHAMRAAQPGPVILAGHSRGGLVLSQAAEQAPDAMDSIAYISGMMLPGGSVRAAWAAHLQANPTLGGMVRLAPGGTGTVLDAARFHEVFAQCAPREAAEAMARGLVEEPDSVREATLRLTAEHFGRVPRSYISCTEDRVIPLAGQRMMIARLPGTVVTEIYADHSPFLSAPDALAGALCALVSAQG